MVDSNLISTGVATSNKKKSDFTELVLLCFFVCFSLYRDGVKSYYIFLPLPLDLPDTSHKITSALYSAGN